LGALSTVYLSFSLMRRPAAAPATASEDVKRTRNVVRLRDRFERVSRHRKTER
jgi:hypothetical protein